MASKSAKASLRPNELGFMMGIMFYKCYLEAKKYIVMKLMMYY